MPLWPRDHRHMEDDRPPFDWHYVPLWQRPARTKGRMDPPSMPRGQMWLVITHIWGNPLGFCWEGREWWRPQSYLFQHLALSIMLSCRVICSVFVFLISLRSFLKEGIISMFAHDHILLPTSVSHKGDMRYWLEIHRMSAGIYLEVIWRFGSTVFSVVIGPILLLLRIYPKKC